MQAIKDYMTTKERLKNFVPSYEDLKRKAKLRAKIILSYIDFINEGAISNGR